jgi:hypothetical protein
LGTLLRAATGNIDRAPVATGIEMDVLGLTDQDYADKVWDKIQAEALPSFFVLFCKQERLDCFIGRDRVHFTAFV